MKGNAYCDQFGFPTGQLVEAKRPEWDAAWEQTKGNKTLKTLRGFLRPVGPALDPQSKGLKIGMVHAERSFNPNSLFGSGGHTGIYLGAVGSGKDTQAVTISAARDLEGTGKEFSYGVEARPFFSAPGKLVMFFDHGK